ncbi:MAG: SpoIIE family protein phosphatase, partial [Bacteroidia bacterium]|nr:SpoIIE family protein phosphatase [Bacteroidia bacterium]
VPHFERERESGGVYVHLTKKDGLSDNVIMSIKEDKQGNIFIGTNFGITVLRRNVVSTTLNHQKRGYNNPNPDNPNPNNPNPLKRGYNRDDNNPNPLKRGYNSERDLPKLTIDNLVYEIEIYNSSTGYPVKDVNGGSGNGAMLVDSKGIVWAGTGAEKTALVRMDYNAIARNDKPPVVIIQNLKVNNENICWYAMKAQSSKVKGKNSKEEKKQQEAVAGGSQQLNDSVANDNCMTAQRNDSLAILNEEILTFGRTLSDAERDTMRYKFGALRFDGITRFYPLPENFVLPYKHNNVTFEFAAVELARPYLVKYQYMLEGYDDDWNPVTNKTSASFGNIWEGTYTFKVRALFTGPGCRVAMPGVSGNQWSEPVIYTFRVLPPWWRTWWMYGAYALFLVTGCWLLVKWRMAKLIREKEILEEKVKVRTAELHHANEEITAQRDEIARHRDIVVHQKKEIEDSIQYAKRIQTAVLPDLSKGFTFGKGEIFTDYFVLFKPKDVVSGDFYWAAIVNEWLIITAADCTGHGVPGAFMSMLCVSFLNEIVRKKEVTNAAMVLNNLRSSVIEALRQTGEEGTQKDGMDMSLVAINISTNPQGLAGWSYNAQWAGANNSLWIIRNPDPDPQGHLIKGDALRAGKSAEQGDPSTPLRTSLAGQVIEIRADKMPVAVYIKMDDFTNHELQLETGDRLFLFSDGLPDQFGGEKGKKFLYKRFKELLAQTCPGMSQPIKSMNEQGEQIEMDLANEGNKYEQIDDITVMGIKI